MAITIEYFYSYQSPYSYLSLDAVYDLEANFDVDMLWQPFSAKASGEQVAASQVVPDKLSYLFEDTKRMAGDLGLPLNFPEGWPDSEFDPGRVTRGALIARDMGFLKEYNYKVFQKWWGLGENPNEQDFMNELCEDLDIDIGDFLSKTSASDTRERVKGTYKRGRKHGIFDTPTFLIGEERVYGADRIGYMHDRLTKMGLKKKNR